MTGVPPAIRFWRGVASGVISETREWPEPHAPGQVGGWVLDVMRRAIEAGATVRFGPTRQQTITVTLETRFPEPPVGRLPLPA